MNTSSGICSCKNEASWIYGYHLSLIPCCQILYKGKPVRDSRHPLTHEPSDACKPVEGQYFPELDVAEVNLAEMNPDEIRVNDSTSIYASNMCLLQYSDTKIHFQAELKRLYTQLEVLRNKTICQNNPHISKRRGGRKVAHRRFSLQVRTINPMERHDWP